MGSDDLAGISARWPEIASCFQRSRYTPTGSAFGFLSPLGIKQANADLKAANIAVPISLHRAAHALSYAVDRRKP
jgi:hypothetical protein